MLLVSAELHAYFLIEDRKEYTFMSIYSEPKGDQSGFARGKVGGLRLMEREGVKQKYQADLRRQKHPLSFYKQCP